MNPVSGYICKVSVSLDTASALCPQITLVVFELSLYFQPLPLFPRVMGLEFTFTYSVGVNRNVNSFTEEPGNGRAQMVEIRI